MATVFTRIIDGELPGRFVWRDDVCVVFLSINPITDGHALVVPREEVDHWIDADPDLLAHLRRVEHAIGRALQRAFDPARVGTMIAGLEVPHLHVHVLPIDDLGDLSFANAEHDPDPDRLDGNAERIRTALRDLDYDEVSD